VFLEALNSAKVQKMLKGHHASIAFPFTLGYIVQIEWRNVHVRLDSAYIAVQNPEYRAESLEKGQRKF
jgi:hypothetical protein